MDRLFLQKLTSCAKSYLEVMNKKITDYKDIKMLKFLIIKSCIYDTYRIDLTSNATQRPKYQYFFLSNVTFFS